MSIELEAPGLEAPCLRIRDTRADELAALQEIDIAANEIFRDTGLLDLSPGSVHSEPIPENLLRVGLGEALLWCAVEDRDIPVGFALASRKENALYLDQVSVTPAHSGKGYGTYLVRRVLKEAKRRKVQRVSLSTFRHIPWNGPFYRKLGFQEIPVWRLTDWQCALIEIQSKSMDVSKRCFMEKTVRRFY